MKPKNKWELVKNIITGVSLVLAVILFLSDEITGLMFLIVFLLVMTQIDTSSG